jgi:hypothetical protein
VLLETLIVAIAVFGRALYPTGEVALHPREIIPYTARHGLPAVLGAVLLGAVFAKVISTASNYLFSPATNLIEDVFVRYIAPDASNKRILIVSRLAVVLLGCWALYQAVYAESILQKMLWAYAGGSGGLLLQTGHGLGRGGGHRHGHGGHTGVGRAGRAGDLPASAGRPRRHLPGAVCGGGGAGGGQPVYSQAGARATGAVRGLGPPGDSTTTGPQPAHPVRALSPRPKK